MKGYCRFRLCMSVCVPDGPLLVQVAKFLQAGSVYICSSGLCVCVNGSDQFVFLQSQHYKSNIDKVGTLYGNLTHICVILMLSGSFIHKHTYKRLQAQMKKRPFHRGQIHYESLQTVQWVHRVWARDVLWSLQLSSGTRQRSKCCVNHHLLRALERSPSLLGESAVSFVRQDCCCFCRFLSVHLSSERKTPAGDRKKMMRNSCRR